jgi:hypothetical protein
MIFTAKRRVSERLSQRRQGRGPGDARPGREHQRRLH